MLRRDEASDPESCFNRAAEDEPMFVLLGRDKSASYAIKAWIEHRVATGKNRESDPQIVKAMKLAEWLGLKRPSCAECGTEMHPAGDRCYRCPNCGSRSGAS